MSCERCSHQVVITPAATPKNNQFACLNELFVNLSPLGAVFFLGVRAGCFSHLSVMSREKHFLHATVGHAEWRHRPTKPLVGMLNAQRSAEVAQIAITFRDWITFNGRKRNWNYDLWKAINNAGTRTAQMDSAKITNRAAGKMWDETRTAETKCSVKIMAFVVHKSRAIDCKIEREMKKVFLMIPISTSSCARAQPFTNSLFDIFVINWIDPQQQKHWGIGNWAHAHRESHKSERYEWRQSIERSASSSRDEMKEIKWRFSTATQWMANCWFRTAEQPNNERLNVLDFAFSSAQYSIEIRDFR